MTIPELFGTTNLLEALRLVLDVLVLIAASIGYLRAPDGQLAFSAVIRAKMLKRRRVQMLTYLSIAIVWGVQTALAASTPDAPVLSPPAVGVSLCTIYTLMAMGLLSLHQLRGWRAFQEIVTRPLQPTNDEQLAESSMDGRRLAHAVNNDLMRAVGSLELLLASVPLTREQYADAVGAREALERAADRTEEIHALVRALAPDTASKGD